MSTIPVIVLGGLLGGLWEETDSDLLSLAFLAMSIGVDDTIHFLTRYRLEAARSRDTAEAIRRTFTFAGRAIVIFAIPSAFSNRMSSYALTGCHAGIAATSSVTATLMSLLPAR